MAFPQKLAALRNEKQLNQNQLAEKTGVHVSQLRRYEAGTSQPTLDVIRNIALALSCSLDELVFDKTERDPIEELRMRFEAISEMNESEQKVVTEVLDSLIMRYQGKKWAPAS